MNRFLCGLLGFILGASVFFVAGFYLRVIPFSGMADRQERSEGLRKVKLLVDALRDYEKKAYDFKNLPYAPKNLAELVDGGFLSKRDYEDATSGLRLDYFGSPDEGWGRDGIVVVGHGRGFAVYGSKAGTVSVRDIK